MKKQRRSFAMLLCICMLAAQISGCSTSTKETTQESPQASVSASAASNTAESNITFPGSDTAMLTFTNQYSLPLSSTKETLTMMRSQVNLNGPMADVGISKFSEFKYIQKLEELTNVHLDIDEVDYFSKDEKMALAIAGGSYPDIFVDLNYTGGDTKAYTDEVILDLTEYLEKDAPNYYNMINSNEEYKSTFLTDGKVLCFKAPYDNYKSNQGLVIRQDWLDELDLQVPQTYDDLTSVLKAFKNKYNTTADIYMNKSCTLTSLTNGYNVASFGTDGTATKLPYYLDNGTVKCSLIEDGYLNYLKMMNSWYKEGFFDADFISLDDDPFSDYLSKHISENQMGVWSTSTEGIDNYSVSVTPMATPVINAGDKDHITEISLLKDTINTYITTNCKNPELALKWMDYWYSVDGITLYNYGLENDTYTIENGTPKFTELVEKNQYDVTPSNYMRSASAYGVFSGVLLRYRTAEYNSELAGKAWEAWTNCLDGTMAIPSYLSFTEDETKEVSSATSDIITLASEMVPKFIIGNADFSEWDEFVKNLKELGIEKCISTEQQAYDRTLS